MTDTSPTTAVAAGELVPLADRLRHLQALRALLAIAVGIVALLADQPPLVPATTLAAGTAGWFAVTALTLVVHRVRPRATASAFGAALILDGLFLAAASAVLGGDSSVRELVILHLIAVALLASYRTGMKLALWHSILLIVVFQLGAPDERGSFAQLIAFSAAFWLVAIVTATFSAVNERELRRRRYDLEVLATMARRLEEVTTPGDVADVLADTAGETFDLKRVAVLAFPSGEGQDELIVLAHDGEARDVPVPVEPGSILAEVMRSGRTRLVGSLDGEADAALAGVLPDARKLVLVPLSAGGHPLGVLVVEHAIRSVARVERRVVGMLERYAAHAALALRNAWLLDEIRHLAATDGLTGIANRKTFDEALGREVARAERGDGQVGLLLMDIDHFKKLNDTYGHQTGDDVLRRVAALLGDGSRVYDTPARYGGEEFAVVLPHTEPDEARRIAERLRAAIEEADLGPAVTVSVGVACFPGDAADPGALVRAADEALYASKRTGRNRVTAASGVPAGSA